MTEKSIIIIGAGIAGLSAGCYAQMNGYKSRIYELHNKPGGLCTAWKRKGYTVDLCIHWLTGSNLKSGMYRYWQEIGLIKDRQIIDLDEFIRVEGKDGKTLIIYSDLDRFEKHLLELAPEDEPFIKEFIATARRFVVFDVPVDTPPGISGVMRSISTIFKILPLLGLMRKWSKLNMPDFGARFKNPFLRETFTNLWYPEFAAVGFLMTIAWLHNRSAGYTIGGSQPMSDAVEKRYLDLGGSIFYNSPVEKILVENKCAVGVRLKNGTEERADIVISAADGHATIFDMLNGVYIDDKIRGYYQNYSVFPPILYIGLGINRSFDDMPKVISGQKIPLSEPIEIAGRKVDYLDTRLMNYDPTLAPPGKTVMTLMIPTSYDYWKSLYQEPERYKAEKEKVALAVIDRLDKRYPGLAAQVEMADVATPVTIERYTGNWKSSWEGWLITPKNFMTQMSKTLPGLKNFFMVGQWVSPGGGLPGGAMTGRGVLQMICKLDKKKFTTSIL